MKVVNITPPEFDALASKVGEAMQRSFGEHVVRPHFQLLLANVVEGLGWLLPKI